MTGQFWGNPYDTLDGKRFIVNCFLRPVARVRRPHELAASLHR